MMAFLNKENNLVLDAEPLLGGRKSRAAYSSEDDGATAATTAALGPLKTLLSPLSSVLSCQAPAAAMTGSSTLPASPDTSPSPSPPHKKQARKEQLHLLHGAIAKGMVLPRGRAKKATKQQGRKDPSYRHPNNISPHNSPLKKRSTTLPASFHSPSLLNTFNTEQCDARVRGSTSGGDDFAIRKARSEGVAGHAHSYDCNYKHTLENVYEDFGVERKMVELKPSRGRTSTYPGMLSPRQEFKKWRRPNHEKSPRKKSTPVDIDKVSSSSSLNDVKCSTRLELSQMSSPRRGRDGISMSRSAPTEAELREISEERLDTERLLSQMGMDVTEEDYCIEGEFTPSQINRSHSFDCNYNHPLENAFEDFGVERKLVELKQNEKKRTRVRSMKNLVSHGLGNIGNHNHSEGRDLYRSPVRDHPLPDQPQVHDVKSPKKKVLKTKVLSVLRGNWKSTKRQVPDEIVAITPTASDDAIEVCPITLDDMRLLYRWQTARIRNTNGVIKVRTTSTSSDRRTVEDVLSITGSSGDKTAPMDNRRRHRSTSSF